MPKSTRMTHLGHRVAQRFFHFGTLFALATWKVDAIICVIAQAVFRRHGPMRRRVFISVLGSAAIWQFAARAQDGVRRVGVIMGFAENDEVWQAYLSTFRQALQNLGWTEGRKIRFDYRFSGENEERMRRMAEEIVGLAPDVILASTNSVASATLKATHSI